MAVTCPVCSNNIKTDHIIGNVAYCDCGASIALTPSAVSKRDTTVSIPIVLFTALLIGCVIHVVNWDSYSIQILPLKFKQMLGVASADELKVIGEICQKRQKENCEVQALWSAFQLDPKTFNVLVRVGEIQVENKNYAQAVNTYTFYFKSGGKDDTARFYFARSLAENKDFKSSQKQFNYLLSKHRKNPQFDVARSYVEYLIKYNEYEKAKNVIQTHRQAAANAGLFMEKELKVINQKLTINPAATTVAKRTKNI